MRRFPGAIGVHMALVAFLAASAAACSSTTAPSAPFTTTLTGTSVANGLTSQQFTSDRVGIATVTLTYGTTSSQLNFAAAPTICSGGPFTNSTPVCTADLAFLNSAANPKVLTFGVAQGQVVTLWIQQVSGTAPQAFSIAVSLQ